MTFIFQIPTSGFKELEQTIDDASEKYYIVETAFTISDVQEMFDKLEEDIKDLESNAIFEHFDLFFHALKLYSQFEQTFRDRIWTSLRQLYQKFLKELVDFIDNPNRSERQIMLNKLKMLSYLFFTCCELNEDKALAFANRPMDNDQAGKKRARKNKNTLISSAVYHRSKSNVLLILIKTLSLKMEQLFEPRSDVQIYVNFMLKYVYTLMANMHGFKNDEVLLRNLCDVFEVAMHRYQHSNRFCQKVIELLQNSEELSASLAVLVTSSIKNRVLDCNLLMTQLAKIQINDLSKDNSVPKAVASFLVDVGKNCSEQMLNCLSTLELMLDQDSHMVRNAVFEIIYTIIVENFKQVTNFRDENIRDQLMNLLEEYICDHNGYCRSKVIKLWTLLAEADLINRERYNTLAPKVAERLEDKSNFVRKSALAFLTRVCQILIPCQGLKEIFEAYHEVYDNLRELVVQQNTQNQNAFKEIESLMGGGQSIKKLREQILKDGNDDHNDDGDEDDDHNVNDDTNKMDDKNGDEIEDKDEIIEDEDMDKYAQQYDQIVDVKTLIKKWHKIGLELYVFIQTDDEFENGFVEVDDDDLSYDTPDIAFNHFRRLLIAKNFKDALSLLPALNRKYSQNKEFIINQNNDIFLNNFLGPVDNCIKLARQIFLFPLLEMAQKNNTKEVPLAQNSIDVHQVRSMVEKIHENYAEYERQQQTLERFGEIIELIDQYDLFHNIITESLPKIYDMLHSKIVHDVLEAIDFFVMAYNLKLKNSEKGIQKMLLLIRSKDKAVKDRLLLAFNQIYMDEKSEYEMELDVSNENENSTSGEKEVASKFKPANSNKTTCFREIKNLLVMVKPLNQGELICVEHLISEMYGKGMFSKTHLDILWSLYRGYIKSSSDDQRMAFIVLGMIACSDPEIILSQLSHVSYSYTKLIPSHEENIKIPDFELAMRTSYILLRIYPVPSIESGKQFFKIDNDHQLFKVINRLIFRGLKCTSSDPEYKNVKMFFFNFLLRSIEVIYLYSRFPDRLIREIIIPADAFIRSFPTPEDQIDRIMTPLTMPDSQPEGLSSQATTATTIGGRFNSVTLESDYVERFLYLITAIMKGFLLHMGYCVLRENQIRKRKKDMDKQKEMEEKKKRALARTAQKETKQFQTDAMTNDYSSSDDDDANAEFGGSMGNDSTVPDFIQHQIFDVELLNNNGYLSKYYNFVKGITYDILGKRFTRNVRIAAWHAMCNFMIASKNITLSIRHVFSDCLSNCPDEEIRAILITYWGDILMRFPNQIEYLHVKLFSFLSEDSRLLKATALKTLSMIILADMLKPTGEIIQMAKLIVDPDDEIQNLTRLFFFQVSNKDNQNIYNYLTDVISSHAGSDSSMSEEDFQEMIKFLFDLLEKSKSTESLVKKLAERFLVTKDTRLWRDLSFALQLVNYQEKSLVALVNKWSYFRTTLTNTQVYENFQSLIQKLQTQFKDSKNPGASKMIETIADLEAKIKAIRSL